MTRISRRAGAILGGLLLTGSLIWGPLPAAQAASPSDMSAHHAAGLLAPHRAVAPQAAIKRYTRQALGDGQLPLSVDLSQYAVTPGDQGSNGACVSWAIAHTMLGWYANKAGTPETFAPMYIYAQTHINNSIDGGGSYAEDAYNIINTQGVDTAAHYTQGDRNFTTPPTADEQANAAQYKTSTFTTLVATTDGTGVGATGITAVKQALAAGTPVGVGMYIYDGFENLTTSNYTWHENNNGALDGGHYVTALGYDSTGLLIENSWGTDWGRKGYAILGWDYVATDVFEAETITGFQNPIPSRGYTVPDQVRNLTVDKTAHDVGFTWQAPIFTGNRTLTGYTLKLTGGGTTLTKNLTATATAIAFTKLTPYTTYTLTITANNSGGAGTALNRTVKTSALKPSLAHVTVTRQQTAIKLTWQPAHANTGKITTYRVAVTRAGKKVKTVTYPASARTVTITHLRPHTTYRIGYTVTNSAGKSAIKKFTVKTAR